MRKINNAPSFSDMRQENKFLNNQLKSKFGIGPLRLGELGLNDEEENILLKQLLAFEHSRKGAQRKSVYDIIGRPQGFKSEALLTDEEVERSWKKLSALLKKHRISVTACSPNVGHRELYRFTVEELFAHKVEVLPFKNHINCLVYDEFHPDPYYDNVRILEEEVLSGIFRTASLHCDYAFVRNNIIFNNKVYADFGQLSKSLDLFKGLFDTIKFESCRISVNERLEDHWHMKGYYQAGLIDGKHALPMAGDFEVRLVPISKDYWIISNLWVEGLDLPAGSNEK